jgi:hypothetical protein
MDYWEQLNSVSMGTRVSSTYRYAANKNAQPYPAGRSSCDPGRIRGRIYDTPNRLTWATASLLDRFYHQPTRDDVIRQRHAAGERTGDLAREYGLSAARVSQIINL